MITVEDWNRSEQCVVFFLFVGPSKFLVNINLMISAGAAKISSECDCVSASCIIERLSKSDPAESAGEGGQSDKVNIVDSAFH